MRLKSVIKIVVMLFLPVLLIGEVISTPNHMNIYVVDARSRRELHTNCAICHDPNGRKTDPGFLSKFGMAFRDAGFKITPEMRDRFSEYFIGANVPVESIPTETYVIPTEQVVINITVTNGKGKYVEGLGKGDFKLTEDDLEQSIQQFLGEDAPLAVAVLLDLSGSAVDKDMDRARKAVLDLAQRLRPDDMLAIYTFGEDGIQKVREFDSTTGDIKPLLKKLKGGGETPLYDAVLRATEELRERPERRRAVVLISDGADSISQATQREVERKTFLAGISIHAIDLINTQKNARRSPERQAAAETLRQMAEETGGRYITTQGGPWWLTSRGKLKRIFSDLIDELHKQYTIAYEPGNVRRFGRWRTIRVNMADAEFNARTRLGYREAAQQ
jgi:Ca-activated chloride channel family protein